MKKLSPPSHTNAEQTATPFALQPKKTYEAPILIVIENTEIETGTTQINENTAGNGMLSLS